MAEPAPERLAEQALHRQTERLTDGATAGAAEGR